MDRAVRKEWAAWWNGYTYNIGHTVGENIIAVLISRGETFHNTFPLMYSAGIEDWDECTEECSSRPGK